MYILNLYEEFSSTLKINKLHYRKYGIIKRTALCTYVGDDGGEVVDGIGGLVVIDGANEALDVRRGGACHIFAIIHVQLPITCL